jgi:hypothetical protein
MPTDSEELYWAAGFLEGEGSFIHNGSPRLYANQTNTREPLERLQKIFGGSVMLTNNENQRSRGRNSKDCWAWQVYSSQAVVAMIRLYPLMSIRRQEQIGIVLEKVVTNKSGNSKGQKLTDLVAESLGIPLQ